MDEKITSRDNAKIKYACRLSSSAAFRRSEGRFLAEGRKLCPELCRGAELETLFYTGAAAEKCPELLTLPGEHYLVEDHVADKLADVGTHQGVFGVFRTPVHTLDEVRTGGRYLALERVQDPGNVGTLLRSAAAFGFDAVLLSDGCASPFAPKTLRASMGAAVRVPVIEALFHVTAGNVDGLPAFSAVEGLLTGNINLVKLPSGDQGLSLAVFQLLTEQEPRLAPFLYAFQIPSRDTAALRRLADLADGAVVWGGDGAVTALRQLAPPGCKLMEWGHRLSFAYLSRWEGEGDALSALAEHLIQTGGLLCSSCQVIFLDTDALGEGEAFCRSFLPLLERAADRFRAALGEKGEGSLYAWETRLEHAADRLPGTLFPGRGCSLTLREDRELELSPLHGNVLVKCLPQKALLPVLRRQKGRLQTAGLLCPAQDRPALTQLLARAGVTRIAPPGSMSRTLSGEGHDGEFPLRRYVRTVDIQEPSPDRPI